MAGSPLGSQPVLNSMASLENPHATQVSARAHCRKEHF